MARRVIDELLELPPQTRVEWQRDELERRWLAMRQDPDEGVEWEVLRAQLERE